MGSSSSLPHEIDILSAVWVRSQAPNPNSLDSLEGAKAGKPGDHGSELAARMSEAWESARVCVAKAQPQQMPDMLVAEKVDWTAASQTSLRTVNAWGGGM